MKRLYFLFLSVILTLSLISCGGGETAEKFRVMVSVSDGATVIGAASIEAERGSDVSFEIEISEGYIFKSVSHGEYDTETGILTLENVTERTNISFYTEKSEHDTETTYPFIFNGEEGDESGTDEYELSIGSLVRLKSNYEGKIFLGWSFGKAFSQGGVIVSEEREYEVVLRAEHLKNGVFYVYANYMDNASRVMYYDANLGVINESSDNISASRYYDTAISGSRVLVTLGDKYFSYSNAFSTFWDDGSFTREGYVLVEYNTKPDGTGEAYSLGSKFYAENKNGIDTLYCIWKKDSSHSDFTYEDYEYKRPVKSEYAPDWKENGVIITGYKGGDACVVVPEKLDGKYVIAIAEGAFVNKYFDTLVLSKYIQKIEDGAFRGCSSVKTLYYPDGLYSISNDAFDEASYKSLKKLYVNATIAPRFTNSNEGAFAVKLSRLLETSKEKQIIFVGGSSVHEGIASEYLEALMDGKYKVVNFGTTRTTHGLIYLEAMGHYADSNDLVIYSPENSIYMLGERELYYKTVRDLEGMNNFYRYIDISNYTNVFSTFSDYNVNYRYKRAESTYEAICELSSVISRYGEIQNSKRKQLNYPNYQKIYTVTLNDRVNSKGYDPFTKEGYEGDPKDYKDQSSIYWTSITKNEFKSLVNHSISAARSGGARVAFAFCPCDEDAVVEEAKNEAWLSAYESLIDSLYSFDFAVGSVKDSIYAHKYLYDSAFHLNDYGRAYRTYRVYLDLGKALSLGDAVGFYEVGRDFEGCEFEDGSDGAPVDKVDFLN